MYVKRIRWELREAKMIRNESGELEFVYTDNIKLTEVNGSIDEFQAVVTGPSGSPYEGLEYTLTIKLPKEYPFAPPELKFITPINHPNVFPNGDICSGFLGFPRWNPAQTMMSILINLRCLLEQPVSPLDYIGEVLKLE